jgi:glycosyltransferase involved in cell wall biosynthesis
VQILEQLATEHEFTVISSELRLPATNGQGVEHVAVAAPRRPALVAFLTYFAGACIAYARLRLRGRRFDLVHVTDCAFPGGAVFYAHFCHAAYLSEIWPTVRGPRSARRLQTWLSHHVRAAIEARLVRRARVVVVPSRGLRRDIGRLYPGSDHKITVIQNTVDLDGFRPPPDFNRASVRERMATGEGDTAFVFVALGHFERKGLPLLLEALGSGDESLEKARLWVVGGERDLVASYRRRSDELGLGERVTFAGRTDDVRPFLWAADAFVSPSHYEAFSLGLIEAAAAGLPLLATRISGSEELLVEGRNGLWVEPTRAGVADGLKRFLALDHEARAAMRRAARESAEALSPERFVSEWRSVYASLES